MAAAEQATAAKIRRMGVAIDRSGQLGLFSGLQESPPPEATEAVRFVRPDPHTIFLGSVRLDEHLRQAGVTAPFVVRRLLGEQDWSAFQARYQSGGRWPYDPEPMTGLILMGLMRGLSSLRSLEQLARIDLGTMWVSGGICPDHSVIGRFILLHAETLEGGFLEALTRSVLRATGSGTDTLAGDGTVIAAQASRFGTLKREALAEAAREAREKAKAAPENEKAAAQAEQLKAAAATLAGRVAARQAKGKPAEKLSLHPNEPEAVVQPQKDKKTFAPSYKPTVLANAARVVVSAGVHPSSETAELEAHLERAAAQGAVSHLLLDAGFHSEGVLSLVEERGIELLCPEGQSLDEDGTWTKRSDKLFAKSAFSYAAEGDFYRCPAGEQLQRIGAYAGSADAPAYVLYGSKACAGCPLRAACTQSRDGRRIKRYTGDAAKEAMRAKLSTAEARARYRQRQAMVEPVFSHLKGVQGLRRFRRRGLAKVRLEFALHVAAYNLSRVVALVPHLAGVGAALGAFWRRCAAWLRHRFDPGRSGARNPSARPWTLRPTLAAA